MSTDATIPRRPTQADVARLSHVSQAMVSYVLNDNMSFTVPQETRQRILDAVDRLGYVPNRTARSLRTRKTHTIASIIPSITNPFYPTFQRGLQDVAESHGYEVIVYNTDGVEAKELKCLKSLHHGRVDGVIATFFHVTTDQVRALLERGIFVVCLEPGARVVDDLPLDEIHVDNTAAARAAVTYLIERGHRRIGLIAARQAAGPARVSGYREALACHQIDCDDALVRYAEFGTQDEQDGYRCMAELLHLSPRPTAVFACNDLMALGALMVLRAETPACP